MTTDTTAPNQTVAAEPAKAERKSDTVTRLLNRKAGATIEDITIATGWQPHSARAFMSGLRKKGHTIIREQRKSGASAYRMTTTSRAKS